MIRASHLTVGQIADIYSEPTWKVRRVVDGLGVEIPRAGLYRLVPRDLLPRIGAELASRQPQTEAGEK